VPRPSSCAAPTSSQVHRQAGLRARQRDSHPDVRRIRGTCDVGNAPRRMFSPTVYAAKAYEAASGIGPRSRHRHFRTPTQAPKSIPHGETGLVPMATRRRLHPDAPPRSARAADQHRRWPDRQREPIGASACVRVHELVANCVASRRASGSRHRASAWPRSTGAPGTASATSFRLIVSAPPFCSKYPAPHPMAVMPFSEG